jgi:hypothetical protein
MSEYEIELAFDEFLDEVYGEVQIGAYTYATSSALKNVDPIAYRIGLSEFEDEVN